MTKAQAAAQELLDQAEKMRSKARPGSSSGNRSSKKLGKRPESRG